MADTFGQSKTSETGAAKTEKKTAPAGNCSGSAVEDGNSTWRPTDSPVESPTDEVFDDSEAKKRNNNIDSETPGLNPDIAK